MNPVWSSLIRTGSRPLSRVAGVVDRSCRSTFSREGVRFDVLSSGTLPFFKILE